MSDNALIKLKYNGGQEIKRTESTRPNSPTSWQLNFHLSMFGPTSLYGWLPFVPEPMGISGFFASVVIVIVKFGLHIKQSEIL